MSQMSLSDVLDEVTDPRVGAGNLVGVEKGDFATEVEREAKERESVRDLPILYRSVRSYSPLFHNPLQPTPISLHPTPTPFSFSVHHFPRLLPLRQDELLLRHLLRPTLEFPVVDKGVGEFHDVAVHSVLLREIDGGGGMGFVKTTEEGDVETSETGVGVLDL